MQVQLRSSKRTGSQGGRNGFSSVSARPVCPPLAIPREGRSLLLPFGIAGKWGLGTPHSGPQPVYRNRTRRIEPLPTARGKDYGRHWGRGGGWSGAGAKRLVPHPCVARFHCGLLQNRSCILFMLARPQRLIRRICRNVRLKRGEC